MKKKCAYLIASWFGFGYSPFASGTVGSLMALPLCWLAIYWSGIWGVIIAAAIVMVIGTFATREVLKYTKHDPSLVVVDEVLGQLLAFVFIANIMPIWYEFLIGFLLFRFFDITKIWPANYFDQKVNNAWGVMLDDAVAGIYAGLALWIIHIYII